METITINSREARTNWRDILDTIQAETAEVVIERYGKPVAVIVPYSAHRSEDAPATALREPTAVYQTASAWGTMTPADRQDQINQLQQLLQSLSAEALTMVAQFTQVLARPTMVVDQTAVDHETVLLPAASLAERTAVLTTGYTGNALADSESLYDA